MERSIIVIIPDVILVLYLTLSDIERNLISTTLERVEKTEFGKFKTRTPNIYEVYVGESISVVRSTIAYQFKWRVRTTQTLSGREPISNDRIIWQGHV